MKYAGTPAGLWLVFAGSFKRHLTSVLGFSAEEAARITAAAKRTYREIIAGLPEFEPGDIFKKNIVSCAMFAAFILNMEPRPNVERLKLFYCSAMVTGPARLFYRKAGRSKFTDADIRQMQETAALRAADRNPYSWNMEFLPYPDDSGYEARFSACGICTLMAELGLADCVPAMCHFDYVAAEVSGSCNFVREHTLAGGGPYCDCGYKKKA